MAPQPIEVHWLPRLRWAAVLALLASIAATKFLLHAPFPLEPMVAVVAVLVAINVALLVVLKRRRTLSARAVTLNLLADTAALTALLVWTGGAMNPFTTLYLLHVALAGVLVGRVQSLVVASFSVVCFGALLVARPEAIHVWHSASMFDLHVKGMWLAFALTAWAVWFFVSRVAEALKQRERDLARAQLDMARAERLATVGTLAAGAAHELNTPLGTVMILVAELRDTLAKDSSALATLATVRAELERCKKILSRMRPPDESDIAPERIELAPFVRECCRRWSTTHGEGSLRVHVERAAERAAVVAPRAALELALSGLLDNARRAHRDRALTEPVSVTLDVVADECRMTVGDRGAGMNDEVRSRAGEPFFTTREPGDGMGLGLYLSRATVERAGGRLEIESAPGDTRVSLVLPVDLGTVL
ncbi:MAG: HAMP domain-containing histidine kinase [Myxococcales bacterium]|nr:HAMP domain-containing histidine kinase [Myxococcales bacterium]